MTQQSDILIVEQMIKGLLLSDNTLRREAEAKLGELMKTKEPLTVCLSILLANSSEPQVLSYAAIIIRKIFMIKENEISDICNQFSVESKTLIKGNLLLALGKLHPKGILKNISDAVVNVFTAWSENEEKWEELLRFIIAGFNLELNEANMQMIELSLTLLGNVYGIANDDLKEGWNLFISRFSLHFKSTNLSLKAKTVNCITDLLGCTYSKKESKQFRDSIFYILETTLQCLNSNDNDNLKICLDSLSDLSSTEPKLLRKSFGDIFILMGKIIENKNIDDSLRKVSYEFLITIIETLPKVISKDQEKMEQLIQSIFKYAMEIDNTIDEDWLTPKAEKLIDEEFIPEEKLDEAVNLLHRLLESLNEETVLKIISKNVNELLQHSSTDWKYKYIAYVVIAEIWGSVKDLTSIASILETIFSDLDNENVKIKYACWYCIAELADSHNPDFQNDYHAKVVPKCLEIFQNSNILRIQLHVCDALDQFIEHCTESQASLYTQKSLDILFNVFIKSEEQCHPTLKEGILNVVSQFIDASPEEFKKYAEKCFSILLDYLSKILQNNINKNLIGVLLETLSTIGPLCPELFKKYLATLVQTLIQIQFNIVSFKDGIANYLMSTWEKLIPNLIESNKEKIPQIFESLIEVAKHPPEISISSKPEEKFNATEFFKEENEHEEHEKVELKTSETEEFSTFLEIINLFLESSPNIFANYTQQLQEQATKLLQYPNDDIKSTICSTFSGLITVISTTGNQNVLHATSKQYISILILQLEKESDFSLIVALLNSVSDIIETTKMFLITPEINELSKKLLDVFDKVEKNRISLLKQKEVTQKEIEQNKKTGDNKIYSDDEDDGSDEELIDDIKDQIEELEQVQTSFGDFFGTLFNTHKQLALELVDKLLKDYIPKLLSEKASNFEKKLALLIIDDMAEFLGQSLLQNIWNDIAKVLISFADSNDFELRNAASYGMGIFAKFTLDNFPTYADSILNALCKAMVFPDNVEKSKRGDMKFARDNAISALGKVIQYHGKSIDLNKWIIIWLNAMPIVEDGEESKLMIAFLMEILTKSPNLVLDDNYTNLGHIIVILAQAYDSTTFSTDESNKLIKDFVTNVKSNALMMKAIENHAKSLTKKKTVNKIKALLG